MLNINGIINKAEVLNQYIGSNIDLFIGGIGLEERCPRGWSILKGNGIKAKRKIIFYFNEVINSGQQINSKHPKEYFDELFDIQSNDCILHSPMHDEVSGLMEFGKYLDQEFRDKEFRNKKIVIDFSVMIKPYLFILLKYLFYIKNIESIYLLYTEPASYHKPRVKTLSVDSGDFTKGTIRTGEISSYSGSKDLTKKTALIILLGFEGERTVEISNAVDSDITIPINGFPAYRPEFKDISIILNEELLREPEILKNLEYAPANDPFETKNVMEDIYSKYSKLYNISIAPLGTKPMALGSCLFALQHPDCSIIYPYPTEYIHKASKGYGTTWVYTATNLIRRCEI